MVRELIIVIFALGLSSAAVSTSACPDLEHSAISRKTPVEELASFLSAQRALSPAERDPECIDVAIRYLAYRPSTGTIYVLIQYLDFRRPLSEPEQHGIMLHAPGISSDYPAVSTLITFGKQIAPILVNTIKEPPSVKVRQNATYTLVGLFREEPEQALKLLKQESATSDPVERDQIFSAAKDAVQWCSSKHKQACNAVLNQWQEKDLSKSEVR